jgi:hypothetical protein
MKCSICNAENPPDATSCHQCGFSLGLSQPTWPEFPAFDVPQPAEMPVWPELPKIEAPPRSSELIWPDDDSQTGSAEGIEVDSIAQAEQREATHIPPLLSDTLGKDIRPAETDDLEPLGAQEVVAAEPLPPGDFSDDALARSHIARGFEAIREGLMDQAQWEFEQARDLADDIDVAHLAQVQLTELHGPTLRPMPKQTRPAGQAWPIEGPTPQLTASKIRALDWKPVVRVGLIVGVLHAVFAGCSAPFCGGFLLAPVFGFVAGWWTAQQKTDDVDDDDSQLPDPIRAIVAGAITGVGGWLGQATAYPVWVSSLVDTQSDAEAWIVTTCLGALFVPMSIALSVLGWKIRKPKQHPRSPSPGE